MLDKEWAELRSQTLKPNAEEELVVNTKRAFYAGAWCFLQLVEAAGNDPSLAERLEMEADELEAWVAAEAMASKDGTTTIDPSEWAPPAEAKREVIPEDVLRAADMVARDPRDYDPHVVRLAQWLRDNWPAVGV